jgi:hypothetical protein
LFFDVTVVEEEEAVVKKIKERKATPKVNQIVEVFKEKIR